MTNTWLNKLSKLRVDRSSNDPAPHKPLLLLSILDQIEEGIVTSKLIRLTPDLAFRFLCYWEVVGARGRAIGRPDLPYFYLQGDGLLLHVAYPGLEAALGSIRPTSVEKLNKVISHSLMPEEFFLQMQNSQSRNLARKILINGDWFRSDERIKLATMLGIKLSDVDLGGVVVTPAITEEIAAKGRDIKFRLQIVPLYRYSCALCRLKLLLASGVALVEAAHIHQFSQSRNDDITNGMALCRNHHWAFDQGLWTLDLNYKVSIAQSEFLEISPNQKELASYQSTHLELSWLPPQYRPSRDSIDWHRNNIYLGE
jgi:putative restriction endonuclease